MSGFVTFLSIVGVVGGARLLLAIWYWYSNSRASFRNEGTKFFLGQTVYYMSNNQILSDKIFRISYEVSLIHTLDNPSETKYYLSMDGIGMERDVPYDEYNLYATKEEVIKYLNKK